MRTILFAVAAYVLGLITPFFRTVIDETWRRLRAESDAANAIRRTVMRLCDRMHAVADAYETTDVRAYGYATALNQLNALRAALRVHRQELTDSLAKIRNGNLVGHCEAFVEKTEARTDHLISTAEQVLEEMTTSSDAADIAGVAKPGAVLSARPNPLRRCDHTWPIKAVQSFQDDVLLDHSTTTKR